MIYSGWGHTLDKILLETCLLVSRRLQCWFLRLFSFLASFLPLVSSSLSLSFPLSHSPFPRSPFLAIFPLGKIPGLCLTYIAGFSIFDASRHAPRIWAVHGMATTYCLFHYGKLQTIGYRYDLSPFPFFLPKLLFITPFYYPPPSVTLLPLLSLFIDAPVRFLF